MVRRSSSHRRTRFSGYKPQLSPRTLRGANEQSDCCHNFYEHTTVHQPESPLADPASRPAVRGELRSLLNHGLRALCTGSDVKIKSKLIVMPPPNPPADPATRPWTLRALSNDTTSSGRHGNSSSRNSPRDISYKARVLRYTLIAIMSFRQLSNPLLLLTALSVLSSVRTRCYFTWRGTPIPWKSISTVLWWSALLGRASGDSLYLLTFVSWSRRGSPHPERAHM